MAKPNQLFLLADHIKLSLLERQRAQSLLNTDAGPAGATDAHDGHISKSLQQFRDGLKGLEDEASRLESANNNSIAGSDDDQTAAQSLRDSIPSLKRQLEHLTSQFHGFSTPQSISTLTHPNDASLSADFAHATSTKPLKKSLRASSPLSESQLQPKTVRFRDSEPAAAAAAAAADADVEAQLFGRYRDDPDSDSAGYVDSARQMDNEQIHAFHERVLAEQDAQLDTLGASIGRQRELSMQIGDELDEHIVMLEEVDGAVTRQQGTLNRAGRQLGRIARAGATGEDTKGMVVIVVLIVILVLLIAVFK